MPQPVITDKISKDDHKLLGLDHLRALAITLVFLFHLRLFGHPAWENKICGFGWTGVDLFFVLSGFLIAGQLFARIANNKTISLKEFFLKRVFRIIPAYLTIVLLYALFPILRESQPLAPLWRYLTFTLNIWLNRDVCNTFTHSWSLCVEEQFYLILPAIIVLCTYFKIGKKAAWIIVILFIAGFIIRIWSWNTLVQPVLLADGGYNVWLKYIYYPTYTRLDGLLVGVSIAGIFTFYPQIKIRLNKYGNLLLIAGLIILIGAGFLCSEQSTFSASVFGYPLIALGYGAVVAGAVCPSCILYKFKSKLTAGLATLSYSIYLIHKIMLHVCQMEFSKLGIDKNSNLMMVLGIACSIAGALLLRYMVEKPFLRLRDRILLRWKAKKALPTVKVTVEI
jgi:peptidoglycan/LPS O-acetylase OafA/YrhL